MPVCVAGVRVVDGAVVQYAEDFIRLVGSTVNLGNVQDEGQGEMADIAESSISLPGRDAAYAFSRY
jgi:hypothetical protein